MKAQKQVFRSQSIFNQPSLNVDRSQGLIKNVVIAQEGLNRNNTYFTVEFLEALAAKAGEQQRGIKARFGHPNLCSGSLGSYIGRYHGFRMEKGEKAKVIASLQLDPICKKAMVEGRGISMWEYILEMAETNYDSFGNSIVISGTTTSEERVLDGRPVKVEVQQLREFLASDLVDDPAATESLFFNRNDPGVAVTEFLDSHPMIFDVIEKDTAIIAEFLERYKMYKNAKDKNMNFLQKIKNALGGQFSLDLTLGSGEIITVATDAGEPQEGDTVTGADGNPLADGEHLLHDGRVLVTKDGVITAIKAPESRQDSFANTGQAAFNAETEKALTMMADAIAGLQKNYASLARSIGSSYEAKPDTTEAGRHARTNPKRTLTFKND